MLGIFDILAVFFGGPVSNDIDKLKEDMESALEDRDKKKIVKTVLVSIFCAIALIVGIVGTVSIFAT